MTTGRINQISTRNLFFVFFPYRYRPKSRGAVGGKSRSHARRNGHTTLYTSSNVNPPSTPALAVSAFTVFPIVCPVWLGFFQYRFSRVYLCRLCRGGPPFGRRQPFFRAPAVSRLRPGRPLRDVSDAMIPTLVPCD